MGNNDGSRNAALANCSGPNSQPSPGGVKACVTRTFVNTIYNYFSDVADCMGYPQKDYVAKLFNESGFQPNALNFERGRKGKIIKINAGIGQFVTDALKDCNEIFEDAKQEILNSDKESCKNIAAQVQKMRPSNPYPQQRCNMIHGSENPLRTFFYIGLHHRQSRKYIDKAMADLGVQENFTRAGLPLTSDDTEQLYQILNTMGYNMGSYRAVVLLNNYLKRMIASKRKVTKADFDFRVSLPSKREMAATKVKNLTFPIYAALNQRDGTPGYVSKVADKAAILNSNFKEGTCVPNSYLAL
jgi:hypothetical protein